MTDEPSDDGGEDVEIECDDAGVERYAAEIDKRLWLKGCLAVADLALKDVRPSLDNRVARAVDMLIIAACERAKRILESDLPSIDDRDSAVTNTDVPR
jgi:hypothetical protein